MWREQFNAEMLSDLDTIRTGESTAIRAARRTDVRPTAIGGLCQAAAVCTRSLRNEKCGRARAGGLNSDGRLLSARVQSVIEERKRIASEKGCHRGKRAGGKSYRFLTRVTRRALKNHQPKIYVRA